MAQAGFVQFQVRVPVFTKKEGRWFISSCPMLDTYSQGLTEEQSKQNLIEALQLFVESCFERGTLDDVLKENGFHLIDDKNTYPAGNGDMLDISLPLARLDATAHAH